MNKAQIRLLIISIFVCLSIQNLIIRKPKELREIFQNGMINATYANFGFNPYGYVLSGDVYYSVDDKVADLACSYDKQRWR